MYDMQGPVISFLTKENLDKIELREFFKLECVFAGFEFDDFVFKPYGYSLNAIKGGYYFTIHVTPQETCPYVSFETNFLKGESDLLLKHFVDILKPGSFDVLNFNTVGKLDFDKSYIDTIHVLDQLSIAYNIDFHYFNKQQVAPEPMYTYNGIDEI